MILLSAVPQGIGCVRADVVDLSCGAIRAGVAARWAGNEPNAAAWLDTVNQDGSIEPILFRELVGA